MKILVIGGRGYVGTAITSQLKTTHEVTTFDRHPGTKSHYQGDINTPLDLQKAIKDKEIVINLVGLSPVGPYTFKEYHDAHVEGTKHIVKACKKQNVKRYIHMGALGANEQSVHPYHVTKAQAIQHVQSSNLNYTVMNPSLIFDEQNELIKRFQQISWTRMFPNIQTKIQPIYRGDLARIFKHVVTKPSKKQVLTLAGPKVMSVFDMAKAVFNSKNKACIKLPLFSVIPFMKLFLNKNTYTAIFLENIAPHNDATKYFDLTSFEKWILGGTPHNP